MCVCVLSHTAPLSAHHRASASGRTVPPSRPRPPPILAKFSRAHIGVSSRSTQGENRRERSAQPRGASPRVASCRANVAIAVSSGVLSGRPVFARIGRPLTEGRRAGATLTGAWICLVITRHLSPRGLIRVHTRRTRAQVHTQIHAYPASLSLRRYQLSPLDASSLRSRPRSRTSCNQNYVHAAHVIRGSAHVAGRFTRM